MSASFMLGIASNDEVQKADVKEQAAKAEQVELLAQRTVKIAMDDTLKELCRKNLAVVDKLIAEGKKEEAKVAYAGVISYTQQRTANLAAWQVLSEKIDEKTLELRKFSAEAEAHSQANAKRIKIHALGFVAGLLLFFVGCIAWAKEVRRNEGKANTSANLSR